MTEQSDRDPQSRTLTNAPPAESPQTARSIVGACATVFVSSACVMIVELLAFRLVTRYLGRSIYTTSTIIGVVLAGLAVGNYVGGRIADRYPPRRTLAILFIMASASCFLVPTLNRAAGGWSALWYVSIQTRIVVHVALTFGLPAAMLGAISPVIAKMALDRGKLVGRTVGTIYAWGVIGSLGGTFLSGFYLIPNYGLVTLDYMIAAVLAVMAVLFAAREWWSYAWSGASMLLVLLALGPWTWSRTLATDWGLREREEAEVFFDKPSEYSHVRIQADPRQSGRRVMLLDKLAHSFYNPNSPNELIYGYERVYDLVTTHACGGRKDLQVLILGGGGYTHPRHFLRQRPGSRLQVVELDPVVTEAAMAAFDLEPDPRMEIIHLDARQHVMELVRRKRDGEPIPEFDLIFVDALNDFNVPYHLTTREFQEMARELLSADGVFLSSLIDMLVEGKLLGAQLHTTQQVFDHVECFFANEAGLGEGIDPDNRTTFVIVASDHDLKMHEAAASHEADAVWQLLLPRSTWAELPGLTEEILLTDDYAPVEFLMAGVVERSAAKDGAVLFYNRGNRAVDAKRYDEAADAYARAIELDPNYFLAYLNRGLMFVEQAGASGQTNAVDFYSGAHESFQFAAQLRPRSTAPRMNLGALLLTLQAYEPATVAFRDVLLIKPDHVDAWYSLGVCLGRLGRLTESGDAFRRALEIDANYPDAAAHLAELDAAIRANAEKPPEPSASQSTTSQPRS